MIENNIKQTFNEVYTLICFLDDDLKSKIPKKLIEFINNNQDENYNFKIDTNKPINEQNFNENTKSFLALIYREYICSPSEKDELDKILQENENKYNKQLTENIFNNTIKESLKPEKETSLVEYKESIFQKIINKLKSVFKKY